MRFAVVLLLLSGCYQARLVPRSTSTPSPYAPVNEKRGGTVTYYTDVAGFAVEQQRQAAYKQMHDECGGPYRIVSERADTEGATVIGPTITARAVNVIDFECVDEG